MPTACHGRLRSAPVGAEDDAAVVAVSQRWWDEIWRDGKLDVIDEIFTDPFVRHTGSGSDAVSGARPTRAAWPRSSACCPGSRRRSTTASSTATVWTRATSKGINRETGERSVVTWLIVQRIDGGRIAEQWVATFPGVDWKRELLP